MLAVIAVCTQAREIRLPDEAPLTGNVLIAESFTRTVNDETVPIDFPVWPGDTGFRPATWFAVCIEAHPGDVLILAPGDYEAQLWIFTPRVTLRTDAANPDLAVIRGTIEVDADGVVLDRVAVTASNAAGASGHGIEVNRVFVRTITIRDCSSSQNPWTGIHIVGATGAIDEMRVERCTLKDNGMDGMDSTSVRHLVVIGCAVTGNGWGLATGVGIRISRFVETVELVDNIVADNRFADVYRSTG